MIRQALLGFDRNLTHLDGHIVRLVREGVTQPGMSLYIYSGSLNIENSVGLGFVQTIHGEGMPIFERSSRGDLFVEYNVVLPMEVGPELRRSKFLSCSSCCSFPNTCCTLTVFLATFRISGSIAHTRTSGEGRIIEAL